MSGATPCGNHPRNESNRTDDFASTPKSARTKRTTDVPIELELLPGAKSPERTHAALRALARFLIAAYECPGGQALDSSSPGWQPTERLGQEQQLPAESDPSKTY